MRRDLGGVHPSLIAAVTKIINGMQAVGYPMMITGTVRTTEEQQSLYAQGRTEPGQIVTNADGLTRRSNHQVHGDGFGYAVDMCFLVDGLPSWDDHLPWRLYGEAAKACGCKWGGDWATPDRPHIEWPTE